MISRGDADLERPPLLPARSSNPSTRRDSSLRRATTNTSSRGRYTRGTSLVRETRLRIREDGRQSTPTEVFFDILYVLPLQNLFGLPIMDGEGLRHFLLFWPALFNSWLGEAFFNTRFDTGDFIGRVQGVLSMVGVVGMASGIDSDSQTFAAFYAWARLVLVSKYVRAACSLPAGPKGLLVGFIAFFSAGILCWAGSAIAPSGSVARTALMVAGLLIEYAAPFLLLSRMVNVHPQHMPERFAGITMLLFAGNLFSILNTGPTPGGATMWAVRPILFALLGISLPVLMIYLYVVEIGLDTRRFHSSIWVKVKNYAHLYLHMPMLGAVQLTSITMSKIDWTTGGTLDYGQLVMLCESVAGLHFFMSVIHLTSAAANRRRTAIRMLAGLVVALLPLLPCWEVRVAAGAAAGGAGADEGGDAVAEPRGEATAAAAHGAAAYDAAPVLGTIVGIALIQVLLDGLRCVVPDEMWEEGYEEYEEGEDEEGEDEDD